MSAFEFRRVELTCNYRDPYCHQHFQGKEGIPPTSGETRAAVRKRAAKAGWTHERSRLGRPYDKDYCPDHKPAEAALAARTEGGR